MCVCQPPDALTLSVLPIPGHSVATGQLQPCHLLGILQRFCRVSPLGCTTRPSSWQWLLGLWGVSCCFITQAAAAAGNTAAARNSEPKPNIEPLDEQRSYSPDRVARTLAAWGHAGRLWFLVYQLVDVCLFFAAYSGLAFALLNAMKTRLLDTPTAAIVVVFVLQSVLSARHVFVLLLLVVDFCEDALQVLLTLTFQPGQAAGEAGDGGAASGQALLSFPQQSPTWVWVAHKCATVHAWKFTMVYVCLAVIVAAGGLTLLSACAAWLTKAKLW